MRVKVEKNFTRIELTDKEIKELLEALYAACEAGVMSNAMKELMTSISEDS